VWQTTNLGIALVLKYEPHTLLFYHINTTFLFTGEAGKNVQTGLSR
jgi:hypothetical protein